jgi:chromosome segregation ATPase
MANKNKNKNELVNTDDDPTAELEALVLPRADVAEESEAAATTSGYAQRSARAEVDEATDFKVHAEALTGSEAVDRLQFDMEVLRAKWQGLSTEIEAREAQADTLTRDLQNARQALQRSERNVAERDQQIELLQSRLSKRDEDFFTLEKELKELQQATAENLPPELPRNDEKLALQAGQLASSLLENRELKKQLLKIEDYADDLRSKLQASETAATKRSNDAHALEQLLDNAKIELATLREELDIASGKHRDLEARLAELHTIHADEIRMIRFELGNAQETLSQRELVAEQLATDLYQTRGQRESLQSKLEKAEEKNQARIAELDKENRKLRLENEAMKEKLQSKSEAINSLLAELAKTAKPAPAESTADEIPADAEEPETTERGERVTRLLVGHIDGQELRFPLFKDRLTIGRTEKNDIQLKSRHISRRHAVVVTERDVTRLIDWGSKNGIFVNSKRVKEHFLKNGDLVSVGTAEFRYEERPKRDSLKNLSG